MFESILMQLTGAEVQGFTASIVALATAAAAIAGIIAKFVQTHTNNQKIQVWAGTVAKDSETTKQSLQATDQWILENQQKFTAGMSVLNQIMTPEQQKQAVALGVNITQWQKDLDDATAELTTIYSTVPSQEAAKSKVPASPL
jgi:hypothetical protein